MAEVVPFPLASRRVMIEKQARYASELNHDAAERHIRQQLNLQAQIMRRRGIDVDLIDRELQCMEAAIRSAWCRGPMGLGGRN